MDRKQLSEAVRSQMPELRWEHTLGVVKTAIALAKRYQGDPDKAELAAIVHDVAKYWPVERLERMVKEAPMPEHFAPEEVLLYDAQLLHAPVGAYVAEQEYGIHDPEVLDAIRYHTTGRVSMTLLDKIICLADYIEPGRDFPGVHEIRRLAEINLEQALLAGLDSTITFLLSKGKKVFPLTILARNALIDEIRRKPNETTLTRNDHTNRG